MAHEAHHGAPSEQSKSVVSFKSSFWLVIILVGLFIAALNFIKVMGEGHEGKEGHNTEAAAHGEGEEAKEADKTPHATESHATSITGTADSTKGEMKAAAEKAATEKHEAPAEHK